ncbi:MAG: extracellular solute-binding protein [Acetobacteraceae bacterium]|nr:extracellular solute-binding protein [Acetobacteraceae bacterium]
MTKGIKRRDLLAGTAATLAMPALAQSKPDKLVYVGDNGPWHWVMVEEVGPAFEKATGIKIDFTLLPVDPWNARLKAELNSGSSGIDIVQWSVGMAGWLSPHFDDHEEYVAKIMARDPAWEWNDFLVGSKKAATYEGKLIGVPYRITTGIMHYQKYLMDAAGIAKLPETFEELQKAAIALNKPPERYGFGISGRQGPAILSSFYPWLYSAGGGMVDFKTGEILINSPASISGLEFWVDLITKYKVVPPEALTWEYEEIVAGGQSDRYAMVQTFAPYGTLINDPKISKSGGKWTWSTVPGKTEKSQSRTWVDGHSLGIPKYTKNKEWSLEFIRLCCDKKWMRRSMERGNAPPRGSVLRDPEMIEKIGWPEVAAKAIETGIPTPAQPVFPTLALSLRAGLSQAVLGQKTAKQALDDVATDWQRGLRRGGIIK